MDLTEEKVSFDQMPAVVSELKQEISGLKTQAELIHRKLDCLQNRDRKQYG